LPFGRAFCFCSGGLQLEIENWPINNANYGGQPQLLQINILIFSGGAIGSYRIGSYRVDSDNGNRFACNYRPARKWL